MSSKYKTIVFLLLSVFFLSCNKESVIEGVIVKPIVKTISTTSSLNTSAGANPAIIINIEGQGVQFKVDNFLLKGYTTNVNTASDSMRYTQIPAYSSSSTLVFKFCNTSNAATKFNTDDLIPELTPSASFVSVNVSKKVSPYTAAYTSINSSITGSPFFSGAAFTPQFTLNSDAYLGFYCSINQGTFSTPYYGWVHIIVGQNNITFDKYAYQRDAPIKAGQEK